MADIDFNDVANKVLLMSLLKANDNGTMKEQYNTPIPDEKKGDYAKWVWDMALKNGRDVRNDMQDYDVQGFFMNNESQSENGHGSDKYKKPNHPTFSDQSQYSSDVLPGGHWGANEFTPSDLNRKMMTDQELMDYFNRVEPGTGLTYTIGGIPLNVMAK